MEELLRCKTVQEAFRFLEKDDKRTLQETLEMCQIPAPSYQEEKDTAEKKRIEFHMHSNMSEMDGVCDPVSIVKYAYNIGHRGIVITDHADVQSFVKAYNTGAGLAKKDPSVS